MGVFPYLALCDGAKHKMYFDLSGIVLARCSDYMDVFELRFLRSSVTLLATVEEMDHGHKSGHGLSGSSIVSHPKGRAL